MRILLSILLFTTFSFAGVAQEKQKVILESRAEKITEKMEKKLKLSPDQKLEVLELNKELLEKRKSNKMEMKAAREEHKAKLKEVLTDEQYLELEKMREERKEKFRNRNFKKE